MVTDSEQILNYNFKIEFSTHHYHRSLLLSVRY